mgnify:CR=1 FL=1
MLYFSVPCCGLQLLCDELSDGIGMKYINGSFKHSSKVLRLLIGLKQGSLVNVSLIWKQIVNIHNDNVSTEMVVIHMMHSLFFLISFKGWIIKELRSSGCVSH